MTAPERTFRVEIQLTDPAPNRLARVVWVGVTAKQLSDLIEVMKDPAGVLIRERTNGGDIIPVRSVHTIAWT